MKHTYVHVVPLTTMGRKGSSFYTYSTLPEQNVQVGNLVQIPFGSRSMRGIVVGESKQKKFSYPIKNIERVLSENVFITPQQLELATYLSTIMGIALTVVFKYMLPQKLTLRNTTVKAVKQRKKRSRRTKLTIDSQKTDDDIVALVKSFSTQSKTGQLLVLFPTKQRLEYAASALASKKIKNVVSIHSSLTGSAYTDVYLRILHNDARIILSLRNGPLLPFYDLSTIYMVDINHSGYKQWDQSPYFDARELVSAAIRTYNPKNAVYTTHHVTISQHEHIKKNILQNSVTDPPFQKIVLLPMNQTYTPIHDDILDVLTSTPKKKSAVVHNRTGVYRLFTCKDCDWVARCETCSQPLVEHEQELLCHRCEHTQSIPPFCPQCNSPHLKSFAPAVKAIERYLNQNPTLHDHDITVTTDALMSTPLLPEYTSIVIVNADLDLDYPAWDSVDTFLEKVFHLLTRLEKDGKLYIQTRSYERMADLLSVSGLRAYYTNELSVRKKFQYPPFSDLVLLMSSKKVYTPKALEEVQNHLHTFSIDYHTYPEPTMTKKGAQQHILVKTDIHSDAWARAAAHLPKDWVINIHPHSL